MVGRGEHRPRQVRPVHPPCGQAGDVGGQPDVAAGLAVGCLGQVVGFGVASLGEQDLRDLRPQHCAVQPVQARGVSDQADGTVCPAGAGRLHHAAVQHGVAEQHRAVQVAVLRRRQHGGRRQGWHRHRRSWRGAALRQLRHQQAVQGWCVRQVWIVHQPSAKLVRWRRGASPGQPVGEQVAKQQGVRQPGGFTCRSRVGPALHPENRADAGGLAGRQRLRQGDAGRPQRRHPGHRHRHVLDGIARMDDRCRSAGEDRGPGNEGPGGGKTGKYAASPLHGRAATLPVLQAQARHRRRLITILRYFKP